MGKPVNRPPGSEHNLTPTLIVRGALQALAFYEQVFEAEELPQMRMLAPGGKKVVHIEFEIRGYIFFLKDEFEVAHCFSPQSPEGEPVVNYIRVEDVDHVVNQAQSAGATIVTPVTPEAAGLKGKIRDPFGHLWIISTDMKSPTAEEKASLQADAEVWFGQPKKADQNEG
jgi:PhnB protein